MAKKTAKPAKWDSEGAAARQGGVPVEVKPVPLWRSGDGLLLGYFAGIFGPNRWANYVFLMPAFTDFDIGKAVPSRHLYRTPDLAMHAWAMSAPVAFDEKRTPTTGIAQNIKERILEAGLFRDPSIPREEEYNDSTLEQREEAFA